MDLDQLRHQWQESGTDRSLNIQQLTHMLQSKHHRTLRRFRLRLFIESGALLALLLLFWEGFEGAEKPWLLSGVLILAILALVLHNVWAYRAIHLGLKEGNIKSSLRFLSQRFRQHAWAGSFLLGIFHLSWLGFLLYQIPLTPNKMLMLGALLLIIVGAVGFSFWSWNRQANRMEAQLAQLS